MPSKYQPLGDYLAALPAKATTVTLTLSQIEALLGSPLPASAWLPSWWASTAVWRPQARAWSTAGWRVAAALEARPWAVTFVRADMSP